MLYFIGHFIALVKETLCKLYVLYGKVTISDSLMKMDFPKISKSSVSVKFVSMLSALSENGLSNFKKKPTEILSSTSLNHVQ